MSHRIINQTVLSHNNHSMCLIRPVTQQNTAFNRCYARSLTQYARAMRINTFGNVWVCEHKGNMWLHTWYTTTCVCVSVCRHTDDILSVSHIETFYVWMKVTSFHPFVFPSAWNNVAVTGRGFVKLVSEELNANLSRKSSLVKIGLKYQKCYIKT
jgi:hypothetical protein